MVNRVVFFLVAALARSLFLAQLQSPDRLLHKSWIEIGLGVAIFNSLGIESRPSPQGQGSLHHDPTFSRQHWARQDGASLHCARLHNDHGPDRGLPARRNRPIRSSSRCTTGPASSSPQDHGRGAEEGRATTSNTSRPTTSPSPPASRPATSTSAWRSGTPPAGEAMKASARPARSRTSARPA